ncbi:hypothetical protein IFM89_033213 [Coptis chinensis]|uniref:non-specific serine/threonine protein kinase n=1 Tax=Coptis chinensis TaxID=261450 RepID=A0A835MGK9_9MAGN|nr:hypothetical protein IFM89_033213 [Coptis chinensis]
MLNEFLQSHLIWLSQGRSPVAVVVWGGGGGGWVEVYHITPGDRRGSLTWRQRLDILHCIARGLLYLHQDYDLHVIHRDLKAQIILLDDNLLPKIADFGTARLLADNKSHTTSRPLKTLLGHCNLLCHPLFIYLFGDVFISSFGRLDPQYENCVTGYTAYLSILNVDIYPQRLTPTATVL